MEKELKFLKQETKSHALFKENKIIVKQQEKNIYEFIGVASYVFWKEIWGEDFYLDFRNSN